MAYPIQNFDHGYYVVSVFEGVGNIVQQLERQLKLTEKVIRHLIVKKDKFAPDFTARIHENTRERVGGFRNFDDPEAAQIE